MERNGGRKASGFDEVLQKQEKGTQEMHFRLFDRLLIYIFLLIASEPSDPIF